MQREIIKKASRVAALIVTMSLPVAGEAAAQDSSTVTTVYESVLSGVTGSVTSAGIGWAMSAIGLAGGDSASLNEIASELEAIDQELMAIESTLVQLLDAIDNQTCVETETQTSLTEAVDNITTLFTNYQTQFIQPSENGDAIIQSQLDAWMSAVLDQTGGIEANLTAIHSALYLNPSSVLLECIQSITQNYTSGAGPSENIVDDRPYYAPVLNNINYYYGVQVQGASILVEALHLEACQAAAASDRQLHCDFATVSTSTSPSEAYEVCEDPTGTVATFCDEATEAVTDPESGTGIYERVLAQMIFAGAPYSNDLLGLLWGTSDVYPKDLVNFTNKATVDGETLSDCPSLTSAAPCGFLVGSYDLTFDPNLTYAGYPGDGESSVWTPAVAEQLLELLAPYNDKSTAGNIDSSGTLGDYMNSIGFASTGDWIVTAATTGKNKDTGSEAICFMDTSSPRDQAAQPWCDGISGEVQGTDNLLKDDSDDDEVKLKQKEYTEDLASNPDFYTADYQNPPPNLGDPWITEPGWLVDAQQTSDTSEEAIFWQYHWPVLEVTELNCTVRSQGHTNPGGEYTMCGGDLQAFIDNIMPPPATGQIALAASADTTLHRGLPNSNDGANPELGLGGGHDAQELVLRFSEDRIRQLLGDGELVAATLRLSRVTERGRVRLAIRPLTDPFVEGNGNLADLDRGAGTGATWHCAEDAEISDHIEECLQHWSRSTFDPRPGGRWNDGTRKRPAAARRAHHDWRAGQVSWDVSEDVRSGIHAWLIRTLHRKSWRDSAYNSREGAAELRNPVQAPTLLLER